MCEYYPPHIGGVELVFNQLAQGLAKRGCDCTIVTCKIPGTSEYEEVEGVKIHRVKVPNKAARYWFSFLAIPKVFTLAKGADLIHTTTFNGAFPAWLVSKLLRKKCIITVHEVWGPLWKSLANMSWFSARLHQFLERVIISLPFNRYICVSNYTCNCLASIGIKGEKSVVIYNGIDYELLNPLKIEGRETRGKLQLGNNFIYMYYGRPGASKGVEYLIQAVPLISKVAPNSKLLLILANDPRGRYENIKKMIKDLDIEEKIILLDPLPRDELPNYIAAADCVVIPSLSEGFGFTATEACAMEKPVVASNVASLPEVISGKYVLVESRNPEAIAEGVEKVYKGKVEDRGR
ncbi:D-inositol 3-phosphate glycosyltransferase [subsurface metagenome]